MWHTNRKSASFVGKKRPDRARNVPASFTVQRGASLLIISRIQLILVGNSLEMRMLRRYNKIMESFSLFVRKLRCPCNASRVHTNTANNLKCARSVIGQHFAMMSARKTVKTMLNCAKLSNNLRMDKGCIIKRQSATLCIKTDIFRGISWLKGAALAK